MTLCRFNGNFISILITCLLVIITLSYLFHGVQIEKTLRDRASL